MDSSIIQSKFSPDEHIKAIHYNAKLLHVEESYNRILVLVERNNSYVLFVLISSNIQPTTYSDLSVEQALPVDLNFKCELKNEGLSENSNKIDLSIDTQHNKFEIEFEPNDETSSFISNLFNITENTKNDLDYSWLHKYTVAHFDENSKLVDNMNELDLSIVVPRQKVAQGHVNGSFRDSVLRSQMKMKENDYTHLQNIRVYIATWNVNGQPPSGISLKSWLSGDSDPPDIYAVGFQELDLSKEAFLFNETRREEEWRDAVVNATHPGAHYRQVALVRLVGILLIVLVRYELYSYVSNVAVDTVGTGILGKMGNKGGVGVRFDLHNTSLCFVNSHLAAHTEEVERRNQDFNDICARMSFVKPQPHTIRDHDQIYWLGDLNYRITDLTAREVKERLNRGELDSVLVADQLGQQSSEKRVFVGYQEGPITFQPTYKYDPGTDHYDTSEKARAPAWCDRILWRGSGMEQMNYKSFPELRISDHKPVSSLFISQIRVVDQDKFRKVHEGVLKEMDKLENEFLPQVTVDRTEIIFDTVRFLESHIQELIIANTGQVPVRFEFIKKLDDTNYCKDWLRITPFCGDIRPGEKCDVQLEVRLKSALDKLYDILVLHLEGGKDVFITVSGRCEPSCFILPLTTLCRAPKPISHLPESKIVKLNNGPVLYNVPRELFLMIDHLYRHGLKQSNLFSGEPSWTELIRVRDWLDADESEPPPSNVFVVAQALLLFLQSTPEPIIPLRLHSQCIAASTNYVHCKQVISQLPELERNIFLYICLFLQELIQNGADANILATVFSDILLPSPARNTKTEDRRSKTVFIYQFLRNDQSDIIAN